MQRRLRSTILWLLCTVGWVVAIGYVVADVHGGALDLF